MWIIYALVSAVSAAGVAIFGKIGLKNVDPTLGTAIRGTIMALLLIGAVVLLKKYDVDSLRNMGSREWIFLILAGIAGAVSWVAYFYALQKGPATAVAAVDRTSIVFVLVLSVLFLSETFTLKSIAGAILIAAGAMLFIL